jgi:DNA-binding HxlR family transcriptional regulator
MKEDMTTEEYYQKIVTSEIEENYPICRTLDMLNGKWRTHIIYELCKKSTCRFGELKKAYPKITNTMLTSTLRDLEELGIVHREQYNEIPPHVEYSLTDDGNALLPVFLELAKWGEAHFSEK